MILEEVDERGDHGAGNRSALLELCVFECGRSALLVNLKVCPDVVPSGESLVERVAHGVVVWHVDGVAVVAEEAHVRGCGHLVVRLLVEARDTAVVDEDGVAVEVVGVAAENLLLHSVDLLIVQVRLEDGEDVLVVGEALLEEQPELVAVVVHDAVDGLECRYHRLLHLVCHTVTVTVGLLRLVVKPDDVCLLVVNQCPSALHRHAVLALACVVDVDRCAVLGDEVVLVAFHTGCGLVDAIHLALVLMYDGVRLEHVVEAVVEDVVGVCTR